MKKWFSIMCILLLVISSTFTVSAATVDINKRQQGVSFEIKDVIEYSQAYGIKNDSALLRIPIELSISHNLNTDLVAEIEPMNTDVGGTLNFNVYGNFYRTSDNVVVSVYGLQGSFEYSGTDTWITGQDSYHNSTASGWSGTSRTSTSKEDNYHISVLKGDYTLFKDNEENNTAWIKVAVSESGLYSVGGDYVSYDVN